MIDERQQELASLYALDLLAGAERTAFEAELGRDAELREFVRELRESTASLGLSAAQVAPPPELKARILAKIDTPQPVPENVIRPTTFTPSRFLPWAIAASLALACAWLGQLYLTNRTENSLLRDQQALADLELRSTRQQAEAERLLAKRQLDDSNQQVASVAKQLSELTKQLAERSTMLDDVTARLALAGRQVSDLREKMQAQGDLAQFKIATLASLAGNSPQALAVAVWNPNTQQGVLRVEKLPALASDKDYQLWVIDPAYPIPVDGGVFTVDPTTGSARINFHPNKPVANATKFAVSLERKGGVPKAEGPMVLLGE